jgi:hypothetical protein
MWIELEFVRVGAEIRLIARGSRGEQTAPLSLTPDIDVDSLTRFASAVRGAALRSRSLLPDLLEKAHALHRGVLGPAIEPLRARLAEAAGGPLLLRLVLPDADLAAVPWEAICKPGEALGFLASSPDLLPVRSVITTEPWQPRTVRGALRVLPIAPNGDASLEVLTSALADQVAAGAIELLDPVKDLAASATALFDRLRREPIPHVLHFLGHGGHDKGVPVVRLADDDDGEETWLPVELLAQQLKASFGDFLRLIVLECCEGARPSAFASAAELLAKAGADAVVAYLWPVKANVARACSTAFYRALAGADQGKGNVAVSMNEARRALLGAFERSAEAFSPVVYLRGPDGVLFDFKGRKIAPPAPATAMRSAPGGMPPAFTRLLAKPFTLVLGDRFKDQRSALTSFRDKLHKELIKVSVPVGSQMSMSALAQRFAMHRGAGKLGAEFQRAFRGGAPPPPFIDAVASFIGPGVHVTLLRHPWFEIGLAEQQPDRTIYVIQPNEKGTLMLRREAGASDWEDLDAPPAAFDPDEDILLFRPFGGYTPEHIFARPYLTEDDYVHGLGKLTEALPCDLADVALSTLSFRPVLFIGLSMHTIQHRMLLHQFYPRGVPSGSLAVLDPEEAERGLWERGAGLPGNDEGVDVIESTVEEIVNARRDLGGAP